MIRIILSALICVLGVASAHAANFYWVGGNGNWNSAANWSSTSGGAGGAGVPAAPDTVLFDTNSGAVTITVDAAINVTQILCVAGFTGTINVGANTVNVTTGVTLSSGATWNGGTGNVTIGSSISNNGNWTCTTGTTSYGNINHIGTIFDMSGTTVNCSSFTVNGGSGVAFGPALVSTGAITVYDPISLSGNISAMGTVNFEGAITLTGNTTINSNNNNIDLESPNNSVYNTLDGAFSVTIQAGTGNVVLPGDIGSTTRPTLLDITGANDVQLGESIFNPNIVHVRINGLTDFSLATSVTLIGDVSIDSMNGNIDFGSATIDASAANPHDLHLNAGTGTVTRNGVIGGTQPFGTFSVIANLFNSTGNITTNGYLDLSGIGNIVIFGTQTWNTSGGGAMADIAIDNTNINSNSASNHNLNFDAGGAVKMGTTQISQTTALSAVNFGTGPIKLIGPAVIGHAITHAGPVIVDANSTIDTGALAQTYTGPIESPNGKFDLTLDTTAAIATGPVGSASFPLANFFIQNGGFTANGEIFADAQDYSAAGTVIIGADMTFNAENGVGDIEFGSVGVNLGNNIARLRAGPADSINFYGAMDSGAGTLDFFGHASTAITIADNIDVDTFDASPGTITFSGTSFWVTNLIHHSGEFIFDGGVASQTLNEGGHFHRFSKVATTTATLNIGMGYTFQADDFMEIDGNGNALTVQSTVGAASYNIQAPRVLMRDITIMDANNVSGTHKVVNGTDGGGNTNLLFGAPVLMVNKIGADTDEDGGSVDLQITLDAAPLSPVTINYPNPDPSEIVYGVNTLTLDHTNYNANNIIQVTGIPDFVDDGDIDITINVTTTSGDTPFNALSGSATFKNLETANQNALPTSKLYFVAPGGTGDGSTANTPLGNIQTALSGTAPGDTIVLAPGTYSVSGLTWPSHNINMGNLNPDPSQVILDGGGTSNFASISTEVTGTGFRGITFQNFTSSSPGPVFSLSGAGEIFFEKCVFKNNSATSGAGGGVFAISSGSEVRMKGCLFEFNSASGSGGAVALFNNGEFSGRGCQFRENSADGAGGAISSVTSLLELTGNYFYKNSISSTGFGGFAIYSEGPTGDFRVSSSVFEANSGPGYGTIRLDGKINNQDGIRNCTFVSNLNTDNTAIGAGVKMTDTYPQGGSHCTVENSIFWNNTSPNNPGDTQPNVAMTAGTQLMLETCMVQGPVGAPIAVNNLVAGPPAFKDPANHDFMLEPGSPGINAARLPAATYDFFGRPRSLSVHPDLGAYESIEVGEFAPVMQSGGTIADYRQLANPFHQPGVNPIEQLQQVLGPFNDIEYRLYVWRHGPQAYQEGPNTSAASVPKHQNHGFPFWLISRSPIQLNFQGEIADHFEPYFVGMDPQWNMIGNPFLEEVPIGNLSFMFNGHPVSLQNPNQTIVNPIVYRWNGTDYEQASSLKPFEAYWVENMSNQPVDLVIEPPSSNHGP